MKQPVSKVTPRCAFLPMMLRGPGSMMRFLRSPMPALRSSESGADSASGMSSAI